MFLGILSWRPWLVCLTHKRAGLRHICLCLATHEYSALGCSLIFDLNTDRWSIHHSAVPKFIFFFLSLHSLWPLLLYLSPVLLDTAFCSVCLAQQETVIAISSSQATSARPDESEEYFRCAALSLAASFAEMLWVIICMLQSVLLLDNRRSRAAAASLPGCLVCKLFVSPVPEIWGPIYVAYLNFAGGSYFSVFHGTSKSQCF